MAAQYKGVPEGASAVIPRLVCRDVEAEIEFCCGVLGAVEALRRPGPDGRAAHAMLKFGPAMLMLEKALSGLHCQAGLRVQTAALQSWFTCTSRTSMLRSSGR